MNVCAVYFDKIQKQMGVAVPGYDEHVGRPSVAQESHGHALQPKTEAKTKSLQSELRQT